MSLWTLDSGTVTLDSGVFTWDGFGPDAQVAVLPGAGNAIGGRRRPLAPYTDVRQWTRRDGVIKVKALAATGAPQLQRVARVRQYRPPSQYATTLEVPTASYAQLAACAVRLRALHVGATACPAVTERFSGYATAKTSERQDVADILTIMELLGEELDD